MKAQWNVPDNRPLADFAPTIILKAQGFGGVSVEATLLSLYLVVGCRGSVPSVHAAVRAILSGRRWGAGPVGVPSR